MSVYTHLLFVISFTFSGYKLIYIRYLQALYLSICILLANLSNLIISISKLVRHALLEAAVVTQLCQILLFVPPILSELSLSTRWPCRDPQNFTTTCPNLLTFRRCSINDVVRRERERRRESTEREGERAYSALKCVPR